MDNQPITSDNHLSIRMVWPWVQLYSLLTFPTPSEAKGPRTGLLTLINSSKASFATYFWMLHMMPKLKGWVDLKDPKANHSWPNLARDSPIAATWATKQCPALLQCQNRMGFPTLGRPESCTAQLPFNESLCATSAAKNHNKTCTNGYVHDIFSSSSWICTDVPMTSQKPSTLLTTSFLATYLSYQFRCSFCSHRVQWLRVPGWTEGWNSQDLKHQEIFRINPKMFSIEFLQILSPEIPSKKLFSLHRESPPSVVCLLIWLIHWNTAPVGTDSLTTLSY